MTIELRPHQSKALKEMHNGCILSGGVGTGKTLTSLVYYATKVCGGSVRVNTVGDFEEMKNPKNLYIITTAKKRDSFEWEDDMAKLCLVKEEGISLSGVKVVVDSWNNIQKYQEVTDAFFIFDEQRLVGSGAWVKSFLKIAKLNQWVLLSATPGDTWMDYIPVFVANGFYKNRTEFLRRHVIFSRFSKFPKVERFIETGRLEKLRRDILVSMPYDRHTVRHHQYVSVDHDETLYSKMFKDRWNVFEDRPFRDVAELFAGMRKLVNSDISRQGALMALTEKHRKMIVFYNFDYELEMLRVTANVLEIPYSEWNGHKHEAIPEGDRWLYLVQYTAGAEGWNCVDTDAMVFWSMNYSYRVVEQAKGRIDRMNTPFTDLYYYTFRSKASIDTMIAKALSTKKTFNERYFVGLMGGKWTVSLE